MSEPRYSIGIDLGTTHCALSYVDFAASDGEKTAQGVLPVTQLTAPGAIDDLRCCPRSSICRMRANSRPFDLGLPWTGAARFRGRRDGAQPRRGHADPARVEREELAVPPGRRPPRGDPAQ